MAAERFDHLLIGTGQATGTLVAGLPTDQRIAIVERDRVGGTCVNTGCTPTKTLVASARVAHVCRRAAEYGVDTGPVTVDFGRAMARMNDLRRGAHQGLQRWLQSRDNVTLIAGHARFRSDTEVEVDGRLLQADHVYIHTGTRPRVPPIPGLDQVPWLDNVRLLDLDRLPEHLVIIGGSYIGLEFGQVFRRFGSEVTVLEGGSRLLGREDPEFCAEIGAILQAEGIGVHTDARVQRVQSTAMGVVVHTDDGQIAGSHLLVAVGRVPNSDDLGLEHTSIRVSDRGHVEVDAHCRTNVPGVYALGDVNGRGAFTHTAVNDAEIVLDLHRGGTRTLDQRQPTYALFIDPPLGRVGHTETSAVAAGHRVQVATRRMDTINRAREMGETQGFVKLVVDADTDLILGASILGPGADEIVNMFTAFMVARRPCREYRKAVFLHPTISELMPFILDGLELRP
ncbi:MAG: mercuric reductase [Myxococcales bacterium]|nr:mercuric reductase [Myxococcales bacterium]